MHCSDNKRQVKVFKSLISAEMSIKLLASLRTMKEGINNVTLKNLQTILENTFESENDQGEAIRQSSVWVKATILGLMSSALFGICWLAVAKTDEVVMVSGKLEPLGSVKDIQMPMGGIASEILVRDGEEVKEGQILIKLDGETTLQRLKSLSESRNLKNYQLKLKQDELAQYLLLNDKEVATLEKTLNLYNEILSRYKFLKSQGAESELQLLKQQNSVSETQGQLSKTRIDRLRQQSIQEQQIQQLKSELEDLESRITEASVNLRYQELKSPVDGIVFDLQPRGRGYVAQSTETVMKIVPHDSLEASIEIPSSQIGFVKVGMPVDLSIDSFPASDFGVLEGELKSIGSDALPPDQFENRSEYRFPAKVRLFTQQLKLKNGKSLPLKGGMSLTSNVKLRKVTYLQLLMGSFQDKVDSLREL